jgi:hypothetical protein
MDNNKKVKSIIQQSLKQYYLLRNEKCLINIRLRKISVKNSTGLRPTFHHPRTHPPLIVRGQISQTCQGTLDERLVGGNVQLVGVHVMACVECERQE